MVITKNPCKLCKKLGNDKNLIKCKLCSEFSHYKCNFLTSLDAQLIKNNENWQCLDCSRKMFPFAELNDYKLHNVTSDIPWYSTNNDKLSFKPPHNLTDLYNKFNDLTNNINEESDDHVNCRYYNIDEIKDLSKEIDDKSLSLFHLNISSLNKHIDNLENLLTSSNIDFDIIRISETRISDSYYASKLNLNNYSLKRCSTAFSAGGTGLYIKKSRPYISTHDLNIIKTNQLESVFIEIINPKKSNIIIGCIYRHPGMDLNEFNEEFLNVVLQKLSKENKSVFLMGDFNVDLLKFDKHHLINEF